MRARSGRSPSTSFPGSSAPTSGRSSRQASPSACAPSRPSLPTSTARSAASPTASSRASLITTSQYFHRVVSGIEPANGVRVHVSGIDLVRDQHGIWRVLEDNVRVPSGVSYVLVEPPRDDARCSPTSSAPWACVPCSNTATACARRSPRRRPRASRTRRSWCSRLACSTPRTTSTRCSPGPWASSSSRVATSRPTAAASTCAPRRAGAGSTSSTGASTTNTSTRSSSAPTRRSARPASFNAARLGNVTISNAVGNGVADDKLIYTYMPALTRYYLSEDPILPNVDTWRLEEREAREEVMDRLAELVVKPVDGAGGKGVLIGPAATKSELEPRASTSSGPARLDRPARRPAVDRPDAHPRRARAAPRRPPALRGQRRRRRVGPARRAHARGARSAASSSSTRLKAAGRRTPGCSVACATAAPWRRRRSRAWSSPA